MDKNILLISFIVLLSCGKYQDKKPLNFDEYQDLSEEPTKGIKKIKKEVKMFYINPKTKEKSLSSIDEFDEKGNIKKTTSNSSICFYTYTEFKKTEICYNEGIKERETVTEHSGNVEKPNKITNSIFNNKGNSSEKRIWYILEYEYTSKGHKETTTSFNKNNQKTNVTIYERYEDENYKEVLFDNGNSKKIKGTKFIYEKDINNNIVLEMVFKNYYDKKSELEYSANPDFEMTYKYDEFGRLIEKRRYIKKNYSKGTVKWINQNAKGFIYNSNDDIVIKLHTEGYRQLNTEYYEYQYW